MGNNTYSEIQDTKNIIRLRELLKELPEFCKDYFRALEPNTSSRTRIAYAYDLRTFFNFFIEVNPAYRDFTLNSLPMDILEKIKPVDIEEFQEYLKLYNKEDRQIENKALAICRKMSVLRSIYDYFYKRERISKNPMLIVDLPKTHEKNIIRLDADEVVLLLDLIENGPDNIRMTDRELIFYEKTKVRDFALTALLLGTGIRVPECVGLDIRDVDFRNGGIKIIRKGGNESIVYFGQEVENALLSYLEERNGIKAKKGHENALFLSIQKSRISVRSVERLVKRYSSLITTTKKITPHKLRSTFGTNLYRETGDLYLVADTLGHKSVETTRKHYSAMDEDRRRLAAKIKLREP